MCFHATLYSQGPTGLEKKRSKVCRHQEQPPRPQQTHCPHLKLKAAGFNCKAHQRWTTQRSSGAGKICQLMINKQVTCPQPLSESDFPIFPFAAAGSTPGLPHITLPPSSSSRSRAPLPSTNGGGGGYSKIGPQCRPVLNQIFRKSWQNRARSLHKWNGPGAQISTKTFRHAQHPGRLLPTTI